MDLKTCDGCALWGFLLGFICFFGFPFGSPFWSPFWFPFWFRFWAPKIHVKEAFQKVVPALGPILVPDLGAWFCFDLGAHLVSVFGRECIFC